MRLICPVCRSQASIEAWLDDPKKMEFARQFRKIPAGLGELSIRYIGLFRPEKISLSWPRAANLLKEINKLYQTGYIQINKKPARPCPPGIWAAGLEKMLSRQIDGPLTSHNYLKKIVYELADKSDRAKEAQRNKNERVGNTDAIRKDKELKPLDEFLQEAGVSSLAELVQLKKMQKRNI